MKSMAEIAKDIENIVVTAMPIAGNAVESEGAPSVKENVILVTTFDNFLTTIRHQCHLSHHCHHILVQ